MGQQGWHRNNALSQGGDTAPILAAKSVPPWCKTMKAPLIFTTVANPSLFYQCWPVCNRINPNPYFQQLSSTVAVLASYSTHKQKKKIYGQKDFFESKTRRVQFCYGLIWAEACASSCNLLMPALCFPLNVSSDRLACSSERAGFCFNKKQT